MPTTPATQAPRLVRLKASMPVSTRYYNTLGVASDEPFPGINIVVTRYADGTTRTTKQLRK